MQAHNNTDCFKVRIILILLNLVSYTISMRGSHHMNTDLQATYGQKFYLTYHTQNCCQHNGMSIILLN